MTEWLLHHEPRETSRANADLLDGRGRVQEDVGGDREVKHTVRDVPFACLTLPYLQVSGHLPHCLHRPVAACRADIVQVWYKQWQCVNVLRKSSKTV